MAKTLRETIKESTDRQVEVLERQTDEHREALESHASELAYIQEQSAKEHARITANAWALQAQSMAQQAEKLLRQDLTDDAVKLAERAVAQDPSNVLAATVAAIAWRFAGYPAKAHVHEARQFKLLANGGVADDLLLWQAQSMIIHGESATARNIAIWSVDRAPKRRDRDALLWRLLLLETAVRTGDPARADELAKYFAATNLEKRRVVMRDGLRLLGAKGPTLRSGFTFSDETHRLVKAAVRAAYDNIWLPAARARDSKVAGKAEEARFTTDVRGPAVTVGYFAGALWAFVFAKVDSLVWPADATPDPWSSGFWFYFKVAFFGLIGLTGAIALVPGVDKLRTGLQPVRVAMWSGAFFAFGLVYFLDDPGGIAQTLFDSVGFAGTFVVGAVAPVPIWRFRSRRFLAAERIHVTDETRKLESERALWR